MMTVALVFEKIIRLLKVCKLELEHGWLFAKENECEPPGKYSTKKTFLASMFPSLWSKKWKLISHQKRVPSISIHTVCSSLTINERNWDNLASVTKSL